MFLSWNVVGSRLFVQEMRHLFLWFSHISRAIGVAVWRARAMAVVCDGSRVALAFVYVNRSHGGRSCTSLVGGVSPSRQPSPIEGEGEGALAGDAYQTGTGSCAHRAWTAAQPSLCLYHKVVDAKIGRVGAPFHRAFGVRFRSMTALRGTG